MAWIDFADFFSSKIEEYKEEVKDGKELQDNQKKFNQKYISLEKQNELKLLAKIGELAAGLAGDSTESSSGEEQTTFTGGTNEEIVWNFFLAKGYEKRCIAGIMGNLQQESSINPKAIQGGGKGPGTGLVQWGNNMDGGRWNQLEDWAAKNKKDKWSIQTQLEWLYIEMEQKYHLNLFSKYLKKYGYSVGNDILGAFKKVDNIEHAVRIFEDTIERAGKPNYPRRIQYANGFYEKYKNYSGGSTTASGQLQNPTQNGRLTSPFGMRFHPKKKKNLMHTGIDLGGGGPIFASDAGTVTKSAYHSGYGNYIIINHGTVGGNKLETLYAHLTNDVLVSAGAKVTKGQKIATMGTTGVSTGIHLHYEVRVNGKHVDPQKYIKIGS